LSERCCRGVRRNARMCKRGAAQKALQEFSWMYRNIAWRGEAITRGHQRGKGKATQGPTQRLIINLV